MPDKALRLQMLADIESELDHLHNYLIHDEESLVWATLDEVSVLTQRLSMTVHHPDGLNPPAPYA